MQQAVVNGELEDIVNVSVKCQAVVSLKNVMNLFLQLLYIAFALGSFGDVVQIDHVLSLSVLLNVLSSIRTQELGDSIASSLGESLGKLFVESVRLLALFNFDQ